MACALDESAFIGVQRGILTGLCRARVWRKVKSVCERVAEGNFCKDARFKIQEQQRTLQSKLRSLFCLLLGYYALLFIIMGCVVVCFHHWEAPPLATECALPLYTSHPTFWQISPVNFCYVFLSITSKQVESCCRGMLMDKCFFLLVFLPALVGFKTVFTQEECVFSYL